MNNVIENLSNISDDLLAVKLEGIKKRSLMKYRYILKYIAKILTYLPDDATRYQRFISADCPNCGSDKSSVTNTAYDSIGKHRRRICSECGSKYKTYEVSADGLKAINKIASLKYEEV